MSDEKHEMMADIVKDIRRQSDAENALATTLRRTEDDVDFSQASCYDEDAKYLSQIADRIEAAWKREKAEIEASAMNVGAFVATTEKHSAVGNAAAMREALDSILNLAYEVNDANADGWCRTSIPTEFVIDTIKHALAAPLRNCDRFNSGDPTKDAADAYDEWQRHCDCSLMPQSCKVESAFRQWLFASAKSEAKGESDGSK